MSNNFSIDRILSTNDKTDGNDKTLPQKADEMRNKHVILGITIKHLKSQVESFKKSVAKIEMDKMAQNNEKADENKKRELSTGFLGELKEIKNGFRECENHIKEFANSKNLDLLFTLDEEEQKKLLELPVTSQEILLENQYLKIKFHLASTFIAHLRDERLREACIAEKQNDEVKEMLKQCIFVTGTTGEQTHLELTHKDAELAEKNEIIQKHEEEIKMLEEHIDFLSDLFASNN